MPTNTAIVPEPAPTEITIECGKNPGERAPHSFKIVAVAVVAAICGALVLGLSLGLHNNSCSDPSSLQTLQSSTDSASNTCWKPLFEMDGHGFLFAQQHVAAFLQNASDTTLTMNQLPPMTVVPPAAYADYPKLVDAVIEKMASVTTQTQKDEIAFFDSKLNIALGIIGSMLFGYGQSVEEIMLHSFGETTAVHDSGVAVWKDKLLNSRIRPTSVIQQLYPEKQFKINNGITVSGRHFQALARVMPHSEYPSGSACVCQAVDEFLSEFWPNLTLTSQGNPVPFDPAVTPVILPNALLATVPLTGTINPSASGYTARTINTRCGETREEGGMHFTPAVPAGRELCAGMGSATAATTKTLIPGVTEGITTIRAAISSTAPCEATCCAIAVKCSLAEEGACAAKCTGTWDLPWFDVVDARIEAFDLPDRTTATTMAAPFFQADRNHIILVTVFGSLVPNLLLSEAIFQFRYTNTIDNLWWNAIAANSEFLKVIKYGQSQVAEEPIVRSGKKTSDARMLTAVHAVGAAISLLLPDAIPTFKESLGFTIVAPTIGFENTLVTACGAPEGLATQFDPACLRDWYNDSPSPARLGQVLAYELMYFKVRDGWNSLGTDDGCNAGAHFCHRYADITNYNAETGVCLMETL